MYQAMKSLLINGRVSSLCFKVMLIPPKRMFLSLRKIPIALVWRRVKRILLPAMSLKKGSSSYLSGIPLIVLLERWPIVLKPLSKTRSNLAKAQRILVLEVHMEYCLTWWQTHSITKNEWPQPLTDFSLGFLNNPIIYIYIYLYMDIYI